MTRGSVGTPIALTLRALYAIKGSPTAPLAEMCREKYTELWERSTGSQVVQPLPGLCQDCLPQAHMSRLTPGYVLLAALSPAATTREQTQVGLLLP